jgi:hypothetical protein
MTSQALAGTIEPRAGGTPQMRAVLGSPCLSLKKFLPAKAGVISARLLAIPKGAIIYLKFWQHVLMRTGLGGRKTLWFCDNTFK